MLRLFIIKGGRVTGSQRAYIYQKKTDTEKAKFLMPDVGYTKREVFRNETEDQSWTYQGDPFDVEFIVEIDTLQGRGSNLTELQRKNGIYFSHIGVTLAWLIDPNNKIMRVYTKNASDPTGCSSSDALSWRDLDGGTVLPGFSLECTDLDAVMNPVFLLCILSYIYLHRTPVPLGKMKKFEYVQIVRTNL